MKILIDGDSCPVVDLTIRIGRENNLETVIFCDTAHVINREGIRTITVEKGTDSVDFIILREAKKGDIVVTGDFGLASLALSKRCKVIRPDGFIYTLDNIDMLLEERHFKKKLRKSKVRSKGPAKRMKEDDQRYLLNLRKILLIVS